MPKVLKQETATFSAADLEPCTEPHFWHRCTVCGRDVMEGSVRTERGTWQAPMCCGKYAPPVNADPSGAPS